MKIMVVDDELIALRGLVRKLSKLYPTAQIVSTHDPMAALVIFEDDVDVVFLDVEMPQLSGIDLGKQLQEKKKDLNIIYITAHENYAVDAMRIHASGYVTKPVEDHRILEEMEHLRYPIEEKTNLLQVQCFGNFEVFCEGVPIHFSRSGSKAILAYLVDRKGSSVTIEELSTCFWEDSTDMEKKKSYVRTMIKALRKTLSDYDQGEILVCRRNSYAVNPLLLDCDYYQFMEDPSGREGLFHGEYMTQYSWAERTLGNLVDMTW